MDASLETLVVAAYVFACSLSIPRPGPAGNVTDQELVALAVAQAITGLVSDRQFLRTIGRLLPGWFPHLPDQTQFNRRLRRLTPWTAAVQLSVAELVATGDVRLVDGSLLGCANYAGCASKSEFAGHASYGYCASKSQWYWGMRLLLITDRAGTPLGYHLRPANENEREGVYVLASAHPNTVLFADAGHRGREHHDSLALVGVQLIVPEKHQLGKTTLYRDHQGTHPTDHRVGVLDPQTPDAHGRPPLQNTPRTRATHHPTTPRTHPRHPPEHTPRPPTTSTRRLRRPMTHIKPLGRPPRRRSPGSPSRTSMFSARTPSAVAPEATHKRSRLGGWIRSRSAPQRRVVDDDPTASESSRTYATPAGLKRKLNGVATAPSDWSAKNTVAWSTELRIPTATRSPCSTPRSASAFASEKTRRAHVVRQPSRRVGNRQSIRIALGVVDEDRSQVHGGSFEYKDLQPPVNSITGWRAGLRHARAGQGTGRRRARRYGRMPRRDRRGGSGRGVGTTGSSS